MSLFKKIIFTLLLSFSALLVAQNEEKVPDFFEKESVTTIEQIQFSNSNLLDNNFLQQRETKSNIVLKQYGSNNKSNIVNNTFSNQKIIQYGNKNVFDYRDFTYNNSMSIGVLQAGNNNNLRVLGANSIFSDAKIIQKGGAKATVINF